MSEMQSESGGRKKNLDLNLVPFIDLMSVLITFLLITAVWTQISLIQIGSSIYGKKTNQKVDIPPQADVVLKLEIRSNGYVLATAQQSLSIPKINQEYDQATLMQKLEQFKKSYPNKLDGAIAMADELPYEQLIKAMDVLLKAGFPQISILTGGPQ